MEIVNSKKLLAQLEMREEDSRRIDAILESLQTDRTKDLKIGDLAVYYNCEFKVFEIIPSVIPEITENIEEQVFKDGREAIDYCISTFTTDLSDVSKEFSQEDAVEVPAVESIVIDETEKEKEIN